MSSFPERAAVAAAVASISLFTAGAVLAQSTAFPGIGRPATPKELAAWDIDVRPDFKGLPKGSGSVAQGQDIWEAKCASCHGIFGESNEVFTPLVGGTTKDDVKTGRVARLLDEGYPGRTTMMKVPTLSTLWDYINRAMPWNAPKTLTHDEVYAVTAFLLNLADVVPENFTLSHANMAEVQQRMPNRNGMTLDHGMWPGAPGPLRIGNGGRPDIKAVACMSNCATEPAVASMLPDFARNQHGNLAQQNRSVGAQLGADTTQPPAATRAGAVQLAVAAARAAPAAAAPAGAAAQAVELLKTNGCVVCHGMENKIVGPGFAEVTRKYTGQTDAVSYLAQKIQGGSVGVWGPIPMPVQALTAQDAEAIAKWLVGGSKP